MRPAEFDERRCRGFGNVLTRRSSRWRAYAGCALASAAALAAAGACSSADPRAPTFQVFYVPQQRYFADPTPLRVIIGGGLRRQRIRGLDLRPRPDGPFLESRAIPLDSGAILPVTVEMVGAAGEMARITISLGPIEPTFRYGLQIRAGGRNPSELGPILCGPPPIAMPVRAPRGPGSYDTLYLFLSALPESAVC